jgi:hypothetical protein
MSNQDSEHRNPHEHRSGDSDAPRESYVLRLLRSGDLRAFSNPELQQEFTRLFELLARIEEIAERGYRQETGTVQSGDADEVPAEPFPQAGEQEPPIDFGAHSASPQHVPEFDAELEIEFSSEILAFDPGEFTGVPETARPWEPDPGWPSASAPDQASPTAPDQPAEPADEPAAATPPTGPSPAEQDQQPERWWVNFNGDVSLERLARVRRVLSDSPFTIEARFDEITDGLIVLRVVTDRSITMDQLDWLIRQVMDQNGLDRNAAILSRN